MGAAAEKKREKWEREKIKTIGERGWGSQKEICHKPTPPKKPNFSRKLI